MQDPYTHPTGIKIPKAQVQTRVYYNDYLTRLQELAINMFDWKGLPPEIDVRFLELTLFATGMAVFYHDDLADRYVALSTMIGGQLDIYQVPKRRRAYAVNGYNKELTDRDSVLIFNNYLREPDFPTLEIFASKLTEIDRSLDTNVKTQKFPVLIKAAESQRMTMVNLFKKYEGNEPMIMAAPALDLDNITTLNTGAPFVADKLWDLKRQTWREAMEFLGIETVADKNAHVLEDEVSANLGYTHAQRFVRLNMRRQACESINRMFGLDVWVDFRSDINAVYNQTTESPQAALEKKEVEERERLYDPGPMDN